MNDDLSDFDDNKIRIPQRNYLMFKDLIGNIINPLNSYYDLEIFFEQHFSNIISSSSEKIFVIFCLCILYPNLKAFFNNGNHFVISNFYKDIFQFIFVFIFFEPENNEQDSENIFTQEEIKNYFKIIQDLNKLVEMPYFIQVINEEIDYNSQELKNKVDENFKNKSNELYQFIKILSNEKVLQQYSEDLYNNYYNMMEKWEKLYVIYNSKISEIYIEKTNEREIAEIKKKLDNLKIYIENNYDKSTDNLVLSSLKEYLLSMEATQENLEKAENFIKNILSINKRKLSYVRKIELIKFPVLIKDNKEIKENKKQMFISSLINYSECYGLIENICKNHLRNHSLLKIEQFCEIKEIIKLISRKCFENNNIEFDSEYFLSLLKSCLLNKLLKNNTNYILKENVIDLLNKFMKRDDIEESDIHWPYSKIRKYEPSFELIIPEFLPKNYIPLFVYKDDKEKLIKGFRLSE